MPDKEENLFIEGGVRQWDIEENEPEYAKMGERQFIRQGTAETSLICAQHYNGKVSTILGDKTLSDSEKIEKIRADMKESNKECLEVLKRIYSRLPKTDNIATPS